MSLRKFTSIGVLPLLLTVAGFSSAYSQDVQTGEGWLYSMESPFENNRYNVFTVRWSAAVPFASFANEYVDLTSASVQNISLSLEWVLRNAPISIGGEIGEYFFKKRLPRQIYSSGGQDISAVQTRTFSQRPIHFFANYFVLGRSPLKGHLQPYAHLGLGTSITDYVLYWGSLADQNQRFTFSYDLGAGCRFLFQKEGKFGTDVIIRFNHALFDYGMVPKGLLSFVGSAGLFYRW